MSELEGVHARTVALPSVPDRPRLERDELLAAFGVSLIVVLSTVPLVRPFVVFDDSGVAKRTSRGGALGG